MTEHKNSKLQESIIADIKKNHIAPKAKGYFVLLAVLAVTGSLALCIAILYVASLAFFSMKQSGAWLMPGFGPSWVGDFLLSLPWLLILAVCILLIILGILIRRFSFAYGRPVLYSILAFIILTAIGAFLVERTPLHGFIMHEVGEQRLSAAGPLYHRYGEKRMDRIIPCTIVERTPDGYVARSENNRLINIVFTKDRSAELSRFRPGDLIAVMGDCEGTTIRAEAIRRLSQLPIATPAIKKRPAPCDL